MMMSMPNEQMPVQQRAWLTFSIVVLCAKSTRCSTLVMLKPDVNSQDATCNSSPQVQKSQHKDGQERQGLLTCKMPEMTQRILSATVFVSIRVFDVRAALALYVGLRFGSLWDLGCTSRKGNIRHQARENDSRLLSWDDSSCDAANNGVPSDISIAVTVCNMCSPLSLVCCAWAFARQIIHDWAL